MPKRSAQQHEQQSNPQTKENTTMTTHKKTTETVTSNPVIPTPAPAAPAPAPRLSVPPPPANAHIPSPSAGFVAPKGVGFPGVKPKKAELVVMPDAVVELRSFVDVTVHAARARPQVDC